MKNLIKKVAVQVIEGFKEDGADVEIKAVVTEVLEVLFDIEGVEAEYDEVKAVVNELELEI